jgi:hypothetical protein
MTKGDRHTFRLGNSTVELEETDRTRFAVGSPAGVKSSTWRFWANKKGDFYLATRTLGGILKTSFHRDGRCHTGFTTEYQAKKNSLAPLDSSRHLDVWHLPEESSVCACQILIPGGELRVFPAQDPGRVTWIPAPPQEQQFVGSICILQPDAEMGIWPGAEHGAFPIALLAAGTRRAWVVGHIQPLHPNVAKSVEFERERLGARGVPKATGNRALLFGNPDDNSRHWLLDLAWQDTD